MPQGAEASRRVLELLALPEIPERGREHLVGVAMQLFYRHGINAVGLDWILSDAGVSKTTFYKHFKSKDELVVAALEARDVWEMGAWREAVRVLEGDDPKRQLTGLLDVLDILFNDPAFKGCQFINAAAEFPNPDDAIHRAATAHKRANRDWVRDLAVEAGAANPEAFADHYTVLFEGALVLRQVHDRDDAARAVRPLIERLIDDHLTAGAVQTAKPPEPE
jgi:AcrR family transcriptional regulator